MAATVIVSPKAEPSRVLGVHGGAGVLKSRSLATGSQLWADWDGFGWVALAPGAHAGMHQHVHTEELFCFLAGAGAVTLDGETFEVAAGDVVLTPLMSRHAVTNTGDTDLEYLVVEVFPRPLSAARFRRGGLRRRGANVTGLVTHLRPGQSVDPAAVFAGPWHSIERVVLGAGQAIHLDNDGLESAVFVEQGHVTLALSHDTVPLTRGDAVTMGKGASGSLTAGCGGTRLFITRLRAS